MFRLRSFQCFTDSLLIIFVWPYLRIYCKPSCWLSLLARVTEIRTGFCESWIGQLRVPTLVRIRRLSRLYCPPFVCWRHPLSAWRCMLYPHLLDTAMLWLFGYYSPHPRRPPRKWKFFDVIIDRGPERLVHRLYVSIPRSPSPLAQILYKIRFLVTFISLFQLMTRLCFFFEPAMCTVKHHTWTLLSFYHPAFFQTIFGVVTSCSTQNWLFSWLYMLLAIQFPPNTGWVVLHVWTGNVLCLSRIFSSFQRVYWNRACIGLMS